MVFFNKKYTQAKIGSLYFKKGKINIRKLLKHIPIIT